MKRGSWVNRKNKDKIKKMPEIADHIFNATSGHLHLVVITHEHEDHVSGFLSEKEVFKRTTIDRLWLAWTEDPEHDLANQLRDRYKDTLLGLIAASGRLAVAPERADQRVRGIVDMLLDFELEDLQGARRDPQKIKGMTLKKAMQVVKERAELSNGIDYLRPHDRPQTLPNVPGVRIFVLGPPEDEDLLKDPDPIGNEEFRRAASAAASAAERSFLAAVGATPTEVEAHQPFDPRYRIPAAVARGHRDHGDFFSRRYGFGKNYAADDDRAWRRIDGDWLRTSEQLALRMSTHINNTSLVLAFELPQTKRVLLFVGDAQRGNWISWGKGEWDASKGLNPGEKVTAKDLLNRTVFYKVGHHGSHNATLNQGGLSEMAKEEFAQHFVAMIPANEDWAVTMNDPPWRHPLESIYNALLKKARGRVFVLDRDLRKPRASVLPAPEWESFKSKCTFDDAFYEYVIEDS
ncbi:MAG TPA: hypothetical protein VGR35_03200 [Tepidisphaeraceae bacterium]|nr:hypothetical protein [Tepidisphaeraceae bacterium]